MALLGGTRIPQVTMFAAILSHPGRIPKDEKNLEWKEKGFQVNIRDTPAQYTKRSKTYKLPFEFVEDAKQYSILEDLKICKKPKLFIAGSRDVTVEKKEVHHAYVLSSPPKYFEIIESDHNYRMNEKMIGTVNNIIGKFLENTHD
jgi:hypothetical protein